MEFLSAITMESRSIQRKILLLTLWWDYIYSLRFICCISNLLWTQVQHKLDSCNLYFIVDIFWSCPVVFPSTLEGFPHKIWYSCVVVFMWCLLELLLLFHNIDIAWQSLILIHTQTQRGLGFFPIRGLSIGMVSLVIQHCLHKSLPTLILQIQNSISHTQNQYFLPTRIVLKIQSMKSRVLKEIPKSLRLDIKIERIRFRYEIFYLQNEV